MMHCTLEETREQTKTTNNINNDEPCFPIEPFVAELQRVYQEKYKMSFVDFLINSIPFLDELETGFCDDYKIKEFKRQFYTFSRFFIPLENLTRVIVNNYKTKQASEKNDTGKN